MQGAGPGCCLALTRMHTATSIRNSLARAFLCNSTGQSWSAVLPRKHSACSPSKWNGVQVSLHLKEAVSASSRGTGRQRAIPHPQPWFVCAQVMEPVHSEELLCELAVLCRRLADRTVCLGLPTAKNQDCQPLLL